MTTKWHPLFARLLRLLLEDFYQVDVEVPVSDLPRQGDLFLVRKTGTAEPPFSGLWQHLREWNVLEFKGPTDGPEEADLDLLMHVGTGIAYRFNEERRGRGEPALSNNQVCFWYLAPALGEAFLGAARSRLALDYETGGLWRGRAWGHPVFLVNYRDTPVEVDTLPLHFLTPPPQAPPHALAGVLAGRADLLRRYDRYLWILSPTLWKELQTMTHPAARPAEDWRAVAEYIDINAVIEALGWEQVIRAVGLERVIEAAGLERLIEALKKLPPEQQRQLRQQLPGE